MKPRRGLGKGLDALLADEADATDAASPPATTATTPAPAATTKESAATSRKGAAGVRMVSLSALRPGAHQPRRDFNEAGLAALAESIRRHGILQPLLVRPARAAEKRGTAGAGKAAGTEDPEASDGREWEIVAGERRWRAAGLAGLTEAPVMVRDLTERAALFAALVENLQRADLNPMERARGIMRLVGELGMTHAAAGAEVGLTRSAVTNILRLLELSPPVRRMVEAGNLEAAHARALTGLPEDLQLEAARRIVARGLSAREAELLAKRLGRPSTTAPGAAGRPDRPGDGDIRILERELTTHLKTRVELRHRKSGGGRLTIHYGDLDALDAVLKKLRK